MNDLPKVTIQIVTYNSLKYLPGCLASIFNQTYRDFQILVVDNNSQDGTVKFLKSEYPEAAVFQNNKNLGLAKADNQGIKLLNSPFVLFCNSDIVMEPDFLEKLMAEVESEKNKEVGVFGGKLLKMKMIGGEINDIEKTDIVDSCGLKVLKNHRVVELGAGQKSEQFKEKQETFGFSGALVLYRRQALDDILLKTKDNPTGEYVDEDFFFYKEDVDLAWRLQLMGWKALLVPQAFSYHIRASGGSEKDKAGEIIVSRQDQSKFGRYFSYRNHFLLLMKNLDPKNRTKYFWPIFWYEIKKLFYILVFEPSSLGALLEVIKLAPKMKRKKKLIMARAKVGAEEMRKWIS